MEEKKKAAASSFLSISDINKDELSSIIRLAKSIKSSPEEYEKALNRKKIALIFQKTSTRTKESFLVGAYELGMFPSYIDWKTSNFTLSALEDEIRVLSMWYDVIMARVYEHADLLTMKAHSQVPIINGLSQLYHPCQALADLLTITEEFGEDLSKIKLSYIGDGNNVCNSLIQVAALSGMGEISVAVPKQEKYQPLKEAVDYAKRFSIKLTVTNSPQESARGADVVYTDTWVSMGDEHESAQRRADFKEYQVDLELCSIASKAHIFMHDMPAHLGDEVTAEVFRGANTRVFRQADNRKHAQKALLCKMLKTL